MMDNNRNMDDGNQPKMPYKIYFRRIVSANHWKILISSWNDFWN